MRVAIHQPHYLPWLRYMEKIDHASVFIVLDTADFTKNGWQNRNKVKGPDGAVTVTVPVHAHVNQPLRDVAIAGNGRWREKHVRTIRQLYAHAPYAGRYCDELDAIYAESWESLTDFSVKLLEFFVEALGIETRIVRASEMEVNGHATDRLVNLVRAVDGTTYYSGAYALETYLEPAPFEDAGIGLELQHWSAPKYPQLHGAFIPDLSIVDLLMNCGPGSLAVLRRGRQ